MSIESAKVSARVLDVRPIAFARTTLVSACGVMGLCALCTPWTFILLFTGFLVLWALLNTEILGQRRDAFDPYPYVFLNLLLSMVAALHAPLIT